MVSTGRPLHAFLYWGLHPLNLWSGDRRFNSSNRLEEGGQGKNKDGWGLPPRMQNSSPNFGRDSPLFRRYATGIDLANRSPNSHGNSSYFDAPG